ncbi:MAG: hypothetical protein B7Y80_01485 [Hyphomicrobium sp. 32-62-53]|nr:MAG: hypothetical protein B7Z29_01835 [Hyphomicrobium sp. 12-62-95]OYY01427.1 MAG: hypothetical protein B7Y80_01485 [Hyphomicrobium sp. 32-62-53]
MPKLARKGDPGSHGGVIIEGSPDTEWNSIPAARVGDLYGCPIHGPNPIVEGSPDVYVNGRRAARVGDATACGAVITDGSPNDFAN